MSPPMDPRPLTWTDDIGRIVRGHRAAHQLPPMVYMELILTHQCNMRCSYCFEAEKNDLQMSEETALASVDFLMEQSRDAENLSILFFGGEPLLKFDLIRKVIGVAHGKAAARGKQISYDMTTNGTLLSAEHLQFFRENSVKFLLSMDGGREDHNANRHFAGGKGSFDLLKEKMPLFKRYQPWQGVKMTVMPDRALNLRHNVEALWDLGINQFIIGHAHGVVWTTDDILSYEQALREVGELTLEMRYENQPFRLTLFEEEDLNKQGPQPFGCGAGRGRFCVDPRGDLYGCSKLSTILGPTTGVLPFGNVQQGFSRIDRRLELLQSDIGPREKCAQCEFQVVCGGGCPALNYATSGNIYLPDDVSCRVVFITQRVQAYMRSRIREIFGDTEIQDSGNDSG